MSHWNTFVTCGAACEQAFDHVGRDAAAHRRVRHGTDARIGGFGFGCARGLGRGGHSCRRRRRQHVLDGDAPALAAAGDLVRVEAALREQTAQGRAQRAAAARRRSARGGGRARGRWRAHRVGGHRCLRRGCGAQARKHRARLDVDALGRHDLGQHAVGRRRDLDRDLVGLDLDQRLVQLRRLADGFQPALDLRPGALDLVGRQHDVDEVAHRSDTRNAAHGRHDITDTRHHRIEQDRAVRAGHVRHGEPLDGSIEVEEGVLVQAAPRSPRRSRR